VRKVTLQKTINLQAFLSYYFIISGASSCERAIEPRKKSIIEESNFDLKGNGRIMGKEQHEKKEEKKKPAKTMKEKKAAKQQKKESR
jgi:hypothetical protein